MERLTETRKDPRDTSFTERWETHYTVKKEKKFKAFDKLGKLKNLEERIGCPLEVRCKLVDGGYVYDAKGIGLRVEMIFENYFIGWHALTDTSIWYYYKDYKKTWWLKPDKSE